MAGLHLVRRDGVYWWRRRLPAALLRCDSAFNDPLTIGGVGRQAEADRFRPRTHLSLSLRTRCPREARRRAVRVTALCDYAWSLQMTISADRPVPHPLALADGLFSFLGNGVDAYQNTLALHPADPLARAEAECRAEAELRQEIGTSMGVPRGSVTTPEVAGVTHPDPSPSPQLLFMKTEIATLQTQNAALREQDRKLDDRLRLAADLEVVLGRIESQIASPQRPPGAQPPAPSSANGGAPGPEHAAQRNQPTTRLRLRRNRRRAHAIREVTVGS